MNKGFFSTSSITKAPTASIISRCGICGLYKTCKSPKMPYTGLGKKKILVVAEAPGREEDKQNTQLIGECGQLLRKHLKSFGVDLDKDCWKTNAVICRPVNNKTPTDTMIEACRSNLLKTIKELKPNSILLLGRTAVKSLIDTIWEEKIGGKEGLSKWLGWKIPSQTYNAWLIPNYHPAYLLRNNEPLITKFFKQNLLKGIKAAENPPWKQVPNFYKEVEIIYNDTKASQIIDECRRKGLPAAFDFETNCIKPDDNSSFIHSCSISWGHRTIAYPWRGEAVSATKLFIQSPCPKIASNLKFEDRWIRSKLGIIVNNWYWDTMIAAHVLDNRAGITSIKFQALVQLGFASYDSVVKPFLTSRGKSGYSLNHIKDLDLNDLLLYNGLDSKLEFEVAQKQMKLIEGNKL